jgi:uncharacterized protein YecE (DUF72 family)
MTIRAGTSGFSYKEWKGSFYPEDLPAARMLEFYASRLPAVEINNTFYRMPKSSMLAAWNEAVPDDFRFFLKASRRITHFKRLKDTGEEVAYLVSQAGALGPKLGGILYQLPPNMKKDLDRLETFLAELPTAPRAAFEFRHASWFEEEVFAALRDENCALCVADPAPLEEALPVATADWGYLRLRREAYSPSELAGWREWIEAQGWSEAFVFFKHEDEGTGPRLAARFGPRGEK